MVEVFVPAQKKHMTVSSLLLRRKKNSQTISPSQRSLLSSSPQHIQKRTEEDRVVDRQVNQSDEQSRICLERQAQDFLNAVLHRKELPGFSDPQIPLVAREIMHRMIRQFAAEYTSKTTQEDPPNTPIKDQSLLPRAPSLAPGPGSPQGPRPLSPLALPPPEPSSPSPSPSSSSSSSSSASSPSPGRAPSPGFTIAPGTPNLTGPRNLTGTPILAGAPLLTGTPILTGAPLLTGAPILTGAPLLTGAPILPGTSILPRTPALVSGGSGGATAGANAGGATPAAPSASSAATASGASSAATAAASAQNPVLSKLLMAAQDAPLDLTVRKAQEELEPSQQDGVLDLSTKKHHSILKTSPGLSSSPTVKGRSIGLDRASRDLDEEDGPLPRSLQDGRRDLSISSTSLKPPLARSLVIKEELRSQKHRLLSQPAALSLANLESVGLLNHGQAHSLLSRESSGSPWGGKARLDNLLKLKQASGSLCGALGDLKELPLKREQGHSPPVDLKIPQVRGVDLSWESHASDLFGYGPLGLGGQQPRRERAQPQAESHPSQAEPPRRLGVEQPRKKRGRYRQYNSEILEEAIGVVMTAKMSVSKAQNIYGIPHSTLEYKVKERMGTLKNPPKKKLKLMMRMEGGPDSAAESENTPTTTPRDDEPPLAAAELNDD
ncbi:unnamed protein product [Boreogadus saida]